MTFRIFRALLIYLKMFMQLQRPNSSDNTNTCFLIRIRFVNLYLRFRLEYFYLRFLQTNI